MPLLLLFIIVFVGLGGPAAAQSAVPEIVQKARGYYGGDANLDAIRSVHYEGRLTSSETLADGEQRSVEAQVEIIVQRPYQQRIEARAGETVETTGLDNYEAWQRVEDPRRPGHWRMNLLNKEQIKRLRANTWENLAFFRGIENRGGRMEDHGLVDLEQGRAHKISYVHDDDIVFHRYFDPSTGQLMLTETDQGVRIREEGEIRVAGVRFPQRIITETKRPDGSQRRVVVEFSSIQVNRSYPSDHFRVPFMGAQSG